MIFEPMNRFLRLYVWFFFELTTAFEAPMFGMTKYSSTTNLNDQNWINKWNLTAVRLYLLEWISWNVSDTNCKVCNVGVGVPLQYLNYKLYHAWDGCVTRMRWISGSATPNVQRPVKRKRKCRNGPRNSSFATCCFVEVRNVIACTTIGLRMIRFFSIKKIESAMTFRPLI